MNEFRSLAGLMMNTDMTVLRDVPQCSALAGAVPCNLIDFSGVTTAFGFAVKMEELHELVKFLEKKFLMKFLMKKF